MEKLAIFLICVGIFGCQSKDDLASNADKLVSGNYIVQHYIVDGDTLWSAKGINKLGWSSYYVEITRQGSSKVSLVDYVIKSGKLCGTGVDLTIEKDRNFYRLISSQEPTERFLGIIRNDSLLIKSVVMNTDSLKERLGLDSLRNSYSAPDRVIFILAKKRL